MVWIVTSEKDYIKILEEHGMTKEEIERRVKETIGKMKNWIDEKTALFVIAKEEGLEVDDQAKNQSSEPDYSISQLSESTQNVNVVGRVTDFSDIRTFANNDRKGQFSWFWLYDSKDQIKVLLWNNQANWVKDDSFNINCIVRVLNGQVKRNRNQELEIHVGVKSSIELSPTDVNSADYDTLDYSNFKVKISQITPTSPTNKSMITVEGTVDLIYDRRNVKKKSTNEDLAIQRIIIRDDSGSIPVVFWEKDVKYLDNIQEGAQVLLENLNAKPQYNDSTKMELSFKKGSVFSEIKKGQPAQQLVIKDINNTLSRVSIKAEVGMKHDVKQFTRDDKTGLVQRIQLQDATGSIIVVFWQEDTIKLEKVDIGYTVLLENVGVKPAFRDQNKSELVFRSTSKLTVVSDSSSSTINSPIPIEEVLKNKEGVFSFEGQITHIPEPLKIITTNDGRELRIFSVHVSDNTEAIQLTFWQEKAEEYQDLTVGENIQVLRASVKMNDRIGTPSASFGRSSQLMRNIDFTLTNPHSVPEFIPQSRSPLELTGSYQMIENIDGDGMYELKGRITDISRMHVYEACAQCGKNITFEKTNCACEEGPVKSEHRMVISGLIEDNTGQLPIVFFRNEAEKLIGVDASSLQLRMQDSDYNEFEQEIKDRVKSDEVAVLGMVSLNRDSVNEMKVRKLRLLSLDEEDDKEFFDEDDEVKRLINKIED